MLNKLKRLPHALLYGWTHTKGVRKSTGESCSRLTLLLDFLKCYFKYNLWFKQYLEERIYEKEGDEKKKLLEGQDSCNNKTDKWLDEFYSNRRFLMKWSSIENGATSRMQIKRRKAYQKHFGLGDNCHIGHNVIIQSQHFFNGKISTGKDCQILEDANLDITGGLQLGYKVSISEGVKILTHNHEMDFDKTQDITKGCYLTPLVIQDRAWLGARVIIMPGVREIGRGAMVSSNAYVRTKVPPYAILMGNPAKVVGFRMTPEELADFEARNYPEDQRIPLELLQANYKKYFLDHLKEIKAFLSPIVR